MGQRRASWTVLDQALRATDLLLQAGGFSSVVLDLGDTAPEQANRIPAATWFRYRQTAERTQCSLVVLGRRAYAQSAAAVVLECSAQRAEPASGQAGGTVLRGFTFAVRRGKERHAPVEITTRKPVAATWHAHAAWDAEAERRA
jgi:recombination protein RecA